MQSLPVIASGPGRGIRVRLYRLVFAVGAGDFVLLLKY